MFSCLSCWTNFKCTRRTCTGKQIQMCGDREKGKRKWVKCVKYITFEDFFKETHLFERLVMNSNVVLWQTRISASENYILHIQLFSRHSAKWHLHLKPKYTVSATNRIYFSVNLYSNHRGSAGKLPSSHRHNTYIQQHSWPQSPCLAVNYLLCLNSSNGYPFIITPFVTIITTFHHLFPISTESL